MARKKHQHYTEEFRKEVVKDSEEPGVTEAQYAKELGVSAHHIANWKRQFKRLSDKQFNSLAGIDCFKKESEEVRALKCENKRLREEAEFFNKVVGIRESACLINGGVFSFASNIAFINMET